jgi:hypothetical protein
MLIFIVVPCILKSKASHLPTDALYYTWKGLTLHKKSHEDGSYMFRSSTILRELVWSLAKVTL